MKSIHIFQDGQHWNILIIDDWQGSNILLRVHSQNKSLIVLFLERV